MKFNPLTPRWQHDDASVRLEAVNSEKLSAEALAEIATKDADRNVRQAAISQLLDVELLARLGAEDAAARTRWAELVGDDLQKLDLVEGVDKSFALAIAMSAPKEEFRLRAVEGLDEDGLCSVLREENLSRVHQHCATALSTEQVLSDMQKLFVDKDKNVSRILKSKLQAIRQERDIEAATAAKEQALLDKIISLRDGEPGADFGRRIDALRHEFRQLPENDSATAQAIATALQACDEILASLPDPAEILAQELETFRTRCDDLYARCQADPAYENLAAELARLNAEWPAEADPAERENLTQALQALALGQSKYAELIRDGKGLNSDVFEQRLADIPWPEEFSKPAVYTAQTASILTELKDRTAAAQASKQLHEELDQQLAKFELEINEGHIKAANRANTRVTKLLSEANPTTDQTSRASLLQNKLQDLKDWQGFATQPKRDDLCAKMELLAKDHAIDPIEKAKAIKELQEEWKKLGTSDSRAAQKSWATFKSLGDEAYAPVAKYFAEQQAVREDHLKAREDICDALEAFERDKNWDEDSINWQEVSGLLQSSSSKWRQHGNVPRRNKKAIEKRYNAAYTPLKDRLQNVQKRHIEQKEALIQELKDKLAEEAIDIHALINRAKSAQQEWKKIGFIDRRKDQKLWKAFRTQCDAVFNKRDEEKQSQQNAAKQIADQYRNACKTFAAKIEGAFERKEITNFRKELAAIDLDKSQRGLERESKKLIAEAERELKNRARQSEELMFREFQRRCDALDQGQEITDAEMTLSKALENAITQRTERDDTEQDLILIRLEILADISSPESSQAARMAYQVERLNRELSQGKKETRPQREQVQEQLILWFTTSNKDLRQKSRFLKIANKLGLAV